jgi:hypothetical protein
MATARIYTHPSGDLSWIGQGKTRITPGDNGLTIVFDSPEKTISIQLQLRDLRPLVLDLATVIAKHESVLDALKAQPA